jgi:hypothetical protein
MERIIETPHAGLRNYGCFVGGSVELAQAHVKA